MDHIRLGVNSWPQYREWDHDSRGRAVTWPVGREMAMSEDAGTASEERYERTTAFVWTERAFELLEAGALRVEIQERRPGVRTSHVWGECPRCGHRIDDWQQLSAVTGLVGGRQPNSSRPDTGDVEPIDIGCGCGCTHPGAPADTTGCGVSFRVELEPVPDSDAAARDS
jgi:hypothetical protein